MENVDFKTLDIAVFADLYSAGRRFDDGVEFAAERYQVMAEAPDGRRWVHVQGFAGSRKVNDDETGEWYFTDEREEAKAKADKLAARICEAVAAGQGLNEAYWFGTQGRYGSDAYDFHQDRHL